MEPIDQTAPRQKTRFSIGRVPIHRKVEVRGLLAFGVLSVLLFGFLTIAGEVKEGDTHAFDDAILRSLRSPTDPADPIGPFWLEAIMRDLTALGGYTVLSLLTLLAITYLMMKGKRASAVLVGVAVVGGTVLSNLLKIGFDRPRPDIVAHLVDVHSLSFPSGHAMLSAATYLTLGALLARSERGIVMRSYFIGVAIALTLMIGASRVYLGVHYPTDVLAGWCAGSAWAFVCWWVARWLQRRGSVEPST